MEYKNLPDNHDRRLKYYEILLERKNVENIPHFPLPEGYRFVFYQDGDKRDWIEIEKSAKEFHTFEEGEQAWERYYGGHESELYDRMYFIETLQGEKVATATAYYDLPGEVHSPEEICNKTCNTENTECPDGDDSGDTSKEGWLHWVAVKRTYQGRGLARPLISRTLYRLAELGYSSIKIPTQTTTWVAAKIYLDFGFTPVPNHAVSSRKGYRILKTLTNYPALEEFETVPFEEIWNENSN